MNEQKKKISKYEIRMKSVVEYVKDKTLEYESQSKVQQIQSMLVGKFQVKRIKNRQKFKKRRQKQINFIFIST